MEPHRNRVGDWMTVGPSTVGPDSTAVEAYERMRAQQIHRMPVVAADGTLVGIVTRSDIEGAVSFRRTEQGWHEARFALAGTTVAEVMTRDPLSVSPAQSVREAAELMLARHLSGLPVLEAGRLVGIITETDIFRLVVETCKD